MPRYGDDQCEECGAVRVAGSKLCAQCLVKRLNAERKELLIKKAVIWGLEARIKNLEALLKEATAYGFESNQENAKLQYRIRELEKLTTGRQ
jgi:uncharacterized OB-fold protein